MAKVCILSSVHNALDNRIFYREARSLCKAGYEVTLLAPSDLDEQVRDGVRLLHVPRFRRRLGRPCTWWALLRRTLRLKPDLIHLHDPELLLIAPIFRLIWRGRVRIVYDVHEYFVDSITSKVWIPRRMRRLVAWLARRLERTLGRVVDGLVFVVEEQAPLYAGWRAGKVVVHNYPDLSAFADASPLPAFSTDRFRLVHIGSLHARRGIMTMMQALTQIVPYAPETLLILGGSYESEEFRDQVEAYVVAHELEKHVVFVGWVDHSRLKDYLASADVAWIPELQAKQYQRRFVSTKLLECMLAGLPIVSGDHPHLRGFLDEADCGISVAADDPKAHAEAILWLYRNPDQREVMGQRGRCSVVNHYTWTSEAEVLLDFYDRLLAQKTT